MNDSTPMLVNIAAVCRMDPICNVSQHYYGAFSSPSRPLLCGKQATQRGETWVTLGGWAPTAIPTSLNKPWWSLPSNTDPCTAHPMHWRYGWLKGGHSPPWLCASISVCCITALFTVSHVIFFFSCRMSWMTICSLFFCQVVFCYRSFIHSV